MSWLASHSVFEHGQVNSMESQSLFTQDCEIIVIQDSEPQDTEQQNFQLTHQEAVNEYMERRLEEQAAEASEQPRDPEQPAEAQAELLLEESQPEEQVEEDATPPRVSVLEVPLITTVVATYSLMGSKSIEVLKHGPTGKICFRLKRAAATTGVRSQASMNIIFDFNIK